MKLVWSAALLGSLALSANSNWADEVIHAQGQPITVWEKGKTQGDPVQALKQLVGLPHGIVGESKQSLKESLIASHARIVSENENEIVARGKMKDGGELQTNFSYYFQQGKLVDTPVEIHGKNVHP